MGKLNVCKLNTDQGWVGGGGEGRGGGCYLLKYVGCFIVCQRKEVFFSGCAMEYCSVIRENRNYMMYITIQLSTSVRPA